MPLDATLEIFNTFHTPQAEHYGNQVYRPDIDGLRALAVLFVVAYHAFPSSFKGGFIGVDIFFVISGFLICGIILNSLANNSFSFKGFYQRRIYRLFPSLIVVLLATMGFGWFSLLADEYEALGKHIAGGAGFIANLLLWQEVDYWDVAATLKPLLHLWSLGIEEQYYIIFPCLLFISLKTKVRPATIIAATLLISLACNVHYYVRDPALSFYMPFTRFWELMSGAILACATRNSGQKLDKADWNLDYFLATIIFDKEIQNNARLVNNVFAFLGFFILFFAARYCRADAHYPEIYALLPILGTIFIIAAGPHAWLNRLVLSNKIAVGVGLISYPLYLWHWPILSYFHILGWDGSGTWTWRFIRAGCIIVAILLAFLTYRYVECPIRFAKQKSIKQTVGLILIMVSCAISGMYIFFNHGLPNRTILSAYSTIIDGAASAMLRSGNAEDMRRGKQYAPALTQDVLFRDAGSSSTVAIFGDSHAQTAFFGIAAQNAEFGLNTFWSASFHFRQPQDKQTELLNFVKEANDINDIFIFYRGMLHLTGNDIDGHTNYQTLLRDKFEKYLQNSIDTFTSMGKNVYIVSENPVLSYEPRKYIARPLRCTTTNKPLPPTRAEVLAHQSEYLAMLDRLHGATIISSIDTFCPETRCLDFLSDGQVIYYDDDHLSMSGSLFQAKGLLAPYLKNIAQQAQLPKD